jgi:hypothetical protein
MPCTCMLTTEGVADEALLEMLLDLAGQARVHRAAAHKPQRVLSPLRIHTTLTLVLVLCTVNTAFGGVAYGKGRLLDSHSL